MAPRRASNDGRRSDNPHLLPLALMTSIVALVGSDVTFDLLSGASVAHLALEAGACVVSVAGVIALWRRFLSVRRESEALWSDLDAARAAAARWRTEAQDHLGGLGAAIDRQFARWSLTRAEADVGLLLLKGLSLKEIADQRATSERTVRQQALAIYRKSGLGGRAELSAFFLEDLLLPRKADT